MCLCHLSDFAKLGDTAIVVIDEGRITICFHSIVPNHGIATHDNTYLTFPPALV